MVAPTTQPDPRDLEVLVTLLQLAAIELTPSTNTLFTERQLFDQAMALGGDELGVVRSDLRLVLRFSKFLGRGPYNHETNHATLFLR
jgi:hypothetical protein